MNNKIKDLSLNFVKSYMRIEDDFTEDDAELTLYMSVAKAYLIKRCSMTEDEFNESSILVIPFLMLVAEFYTNKNVTISTNSKVNSILDRFIAIEAPLF